jgi:hypothetical protein
VAFSYESRRSSQVSALLISPTFRTLPRGFGGFFS